MENTNVPLGSAEVEAFDYIKAVNVWSGVIDMIGEAKVLLRCRRSPD